MKKPDFFRIMSIASVAFCFSVPGVGLCETEMPSEFRELKAMQMDLNRRPLEQQERLQPKVRQAERQACQKLREEQRKGVRPETYRQEGGDELLALVQQFDSYCQTLE